jgi:hypothetical protein
MFMPQKDSVYGMVSQSIGLFENGLDQTGTIYICEGGLVIKNSGQFIRAPLDYVKKLEQVEEMPMGRVSVIVQVFDQMGGEYNFATSMADMHLKVLQKLCPKAKTK